MKTYMKEQDKQVIRLASESHLIRSGLAGPNALCPLIFKSVTPALKEQGAGISRLFHWTESWMLILRATIEGLCLLRSDCC
jgi:hypothetical protein